MPVDSSLAFLQVLEKSSLLSSDKLSKVRQLCETENDVKPVARTLIKDGVLTKWQALQLLAGRYALTIGDYALIDQVGSDESTQVFLTRDPATGQQAVLKTISRRQTKESPDAVEQFVVKVQEEAAEQKRKVLAVQRPTKDNERCFVVVAKNASDAAAGSGESSPAATQKKPSPPKAEGAKDSGGGIQIGPIGGTDGPAAAPAIGGFAIETGPKRRRKVRKSAPAKAPDKPAAKAPSKPAVKASSKPAVKAPSKSAAKAPSAVAEQAIEQTISAEFDEDEEGVVVLEAPKSPMRMLIVGAVVAGLLLTTGIVLTLIFLFSGGDGDAPELADAGGSETQEVAQADAGDGDTDPEIAMGDPEFDPEADPVIAVVPGGDSDAESDPVIPVIDDPPPVAADTPADASASEGSPASGDPEPQSVSTEDATMTDTGAASPPEASPAGDATAEPDAAAAVPQDEPPGEAEPPQAKPKPAVPNKKPFADLAKAFTLPDFEGGQAKTLGSVYIPEGELCFIRLRGGVNACKGPQEIGLRNAEDGLAERDWEISAKDGDAGSEVKIAHLTVNDKHELGFQWQPEAKTQPVAAYLTNCAFSFSCAGESHVATLREPTQAEGMLVDFDKSITKDDWVIESCPEPAKVRIEITGVQGAKYTVEPAPIMEADKATAWVRIQDGGGMLAFKLETSMRRNLQVSLEPHIKLMPDMPAQKFSNRVLKTYLMQATKEQQQYAMLVQQGQQAMKQRGISEEDKRRKIQPRLAMVEADLAKADTAVKDLNALNELMTALSDNMRIKFRVFYDADSSQVDLLQIGS